jgi:hypothetical protein
MYRMLVCVCASLSPLAVQAGPVQPEIACNMVGKSRVYDCTIKLTDRQTGTPLTGAVFTVTADMASMPMAHNVRPVTAIATGEPGVYHARLDLEMAGTWTLKLILSQPTRDQVTQRIDFQ